MTPKPSCYVILDVHICTHLQEPCGQRFAVAAGAALATPRLLAARLLLPAALRAPQRPQVKVVAAAAAAVAAASMWCRCQQPPS